MGRPALRVKVSKKDQTALKKLLAGGVEQVRVTLRAVALQRLGEGMSAPQIAAVLPLSGVERVLPGWEELTLGSFPSIMTRFLLSVRPSSATIP